MHKKLLFFFFFCSIHICQGQWLQQQVPFTTQSYFFDVEATSAVNVWAGFYTISGTTINTNNQFSRTIDGGTTWTIGTVNGAPASHHVSNIWPIDEDTCYLAMFNNTVGTGGGIYKTSDGGLNWTRMGTASMFNNVSFPNVVHFFNPAEGIAIGDPNPGTYFEIWRTSDFGQSWTRVPQIDIPAADASGEYGIVNLFCTDNNTIWFGTDIGNVYRSMDKGLTWTKHATNMLVQDQTIDDMVFVDGSHGFCTQGTLLYASDDGGTTWNLRPYTGTMFTGDLEYAPFSPILVSAGSSTSTGFGTSYSLDLGLSWHLLDTNVSHTAMDFLGTYLGWSGEVSNGSGGAYILTQILNLANPTHDQAEISVYPNPAQGKVNIRVLSKGEPFTLRLLNSLGVELANWQIDESASSFVQSLDISGYSPGFYFLQLQGNDQNRLIKVLMN